MIESQLLDKLEYDIVVVGTDLVPSIAAALLAKTGKSVLHLDTMHDYGDTMTTFSLRNLYEMVMQPETQELFEIHKKDGDIFLDPDTYLRIRASQYQLDINGQLTFCQGDFLETLLSSDVAKYLEFRLLDDTTIDLGSAYDDATDEPNSFFTIPTCKEDIFAARSLSLIEKRRLMKLMSLVSNEEVIFQDEQDSSLKLDHWLEKNIQLNPRLIEAVNLGLIFTNQQVDAKTGVEHIRQYLRSFGRYGKGALLYPVYGVSEYVQGFCRMCAVFGGLYLMGQRYELSIRDEANDKIFIAIGNQEIKADWLITTSRLLASPDQRQEKRWLRQVTLFKGNLNENANPRLFVRRNESIIYSLALGPGTKTTPEGQVWLISLVELPSSKSLQYGLNLLQEHVDRIIKNIHGKGEEGPCVIFSMSFEFKPVPVTSNNLLLSEKVICVDVEKSANLTTDYSVQLAKQITMRILGTDQWFVKEQVQQKDEDEEDEEQ